MYRALSSTVHLTATLLIAISVTGAVFAQAGYRIAAEVDGFTGNEAYLANYFMDKQYIVDTAKAVGGKFVFAGEETLPQGTYLIVLPPDNDYAQLQIDADQDFSIRTKADDLVGSMRVKGSEENQLFYGYLSFLAEMRPLSDSLRALQQDSTLSAADRKAAELEGKRVDERVRAKQLEIKTKHAATNTAAILRAMDETPMPEFTGTEEEVQEQRYRFYKRHYFDHIDLGDPRALRSSYLDQRVTYYLDKLVVPAPDSIIVELDYLLEQMRPNDETFRFYVSKFLNQFASSKIVGQDAVYAHLGEKYYVGGQTPWVDSTTLAKIADNVSRIKPLLIGKKAPPLTLRDRDNKEIDLYSLKTPFTVLFFYDPECGHCKKQTPFVIDFAKAYKSRGVSTISICSKFFPDRDSCWSYVDSKEGMRDNMYNAYDPYHKSKYKITYDITSTPQIYVLDENKTIVSKRIGAEQLDEVVGRLVSLREEQEILEQSEGR